MCLRTSNRIAQYVNIIMACLQQAIEFDHIKLVYGAPESVSIGYVTIISVWLGGEAEQVSV